MPALLRDNLHLPVAVALGVALAALKADPLYGVVAIALGAIALKWALRGRPLGWLVEYVCLSVAAWGVAATFLLA